MPIKTDSSGMRSLELELTAPGTPEQIWEVVATGPGNAAWFATAEIEPAVGGHVVFHMGGGVEGRGEVTVWNPPSRFAYEERDWAPGAPPLATEFTIQSLGGGNCLVRIVHRLFAARDDWDEHLEGMERGWQPHFDLLRRYLERFAGQPARVVRVMGRYEGDVKSGWTSLRAALGLIGVAPQDAYQSPSRAPRLSGQVRKISTHENHEELLLDLDEPTPGQALFGACNWGGTLVAVALFLYGPQAAAVAQREEPQWAEWIKERFS